MTPLKLLMTLPMLLALATPSISTETPPGMMACAPAAEMTQVLKDKYGEDRVFTGVANNGVGAIFLFRSPGGSWTMLVRAPHEYMCIITDGKQSDVIE